ncbi:MAG TPA: hypothetical protein VG982_01715 [Candidatus Paceibacterota bacterium]|nr:hypothetical protein [Candidatus Paceibacterota bacterium]
MDNHNKKEKYIVSKLLEMVGEFRQLFFQNNEKDVVPLRMQLIGGFTIIDVLGSYWFEYLNKTGTPRERFFEFTEKFCLTPKNKIYAVSTLIKGATKERLYDLRSSLVHFYGLGKHKDFGIAANISKTHTSEVIQNMVIEFRKKVPNLIFIQPTELRDIIVEGTSLMFESMIENINKSHTNENTKKAHIEGIERIYNKLFEEGAEGIA